MTDFFKAVIDIKKYTESGDKEGLCRSIAICSDNYYSDVGSILHVLLMNVMTERPLLLEDNNVYKEWTAAIRMADNSFYSNCKGLSMIRSTVLRAVIFKERNEADILKMAENCFLGTSGNLTVNVFSEHSEREIFCKSVIMAADLFDNCEVIEYEAERYAEEPNKYQSYESVWMLVRALADREMFPQLDRLYKELFDSDFGKLIGSCYIFEHWDKDCMGYIKMLYRRYVTGGRILDDENERICRLIDENGSEYIRSCLMLRGIWNGTLNMINHANIMEIKKLLEIGYRINDLSAAIHFINRFDENDEQYKLIMEMIGESPYIYIEEMFKLQYPTERYCRLLDIKNAAVSLDNHNGSKESVNLFSSYFTESRMKKLPKSLPLLLTDDVRENDCLEQVIRDKATGFEYILKRIDFNAEQLTGLVDMCIKHNNLKGLNLVRRRLDEKMRKGAENNAGKR